MSDYIYVYFSDESAERFFDLSVSKLRTAQRFGLIEAGSVKRNKRNVRTWSAKSLLRAYVVEEACNFTNLPFVVCCQIFAAGPKESWKLFAQAAFNGLETVQLPTLSIINLSVVAAEYSGPEYVVLGSLEKDLSGRSMFKPDRHPFDGDYRGLAKPEPISFILYDPTGPVRQFREKYHRALEQRAGSA